MRATLTLLAFTCLTAVALAQDKPAKRYNVEADLDTYPQTSAKETLNSVIRAVEEKRISYLLAQLADPDFVDKRVREDHGGKFDDLVKEATGRLVNDPGALKKLRRFVKEGEWETDDTSASARIKDVRERVYFRKIGNRWFFEDRNKPPAEGK